MIRGSWRDFNFLVILLLSLLQAHRGLSQNSKTDSLIDLYNRSSSDDEKMKLAGRIATFNARKDSSIFLFYANEVVKLSEKLDDKLFHGYANFDLGSFYEEKNIIKALDYANKSLNDFTELDSLGLVAMVRTLIGSIYFYSGNYSKSYENFLESLKINEKTGNLYNLGTDYNNIAIIHSAQKNQVKAVEFYKKALAIGKKYDDKELYPTLLLNISVSYNEMDSLKQAINYGHLAIDSLSKIKDKSLLPHLLLNLSEVYIKDNNITKAEIYLNEAEKNIDKSNNYYLCFFNNTKGKLMAASNKFGDAIKAYEYAYFTSIKEGILPFAKDACEDLSKVFKKLNMQKEALYYTERYHAIKDSINNTEKTKKITELELQYKFDKQLEINQKEEENQKKLVSLQRKIIGFSFAALIFAIIVVTLTIYNYRLKHKSYALLSEMNSQIQNQSNEIKEQRDKLQQLNLSKDKINSIIAHDLKNQFNSMQGFTRLIIENWCELSENRKLLYLSKVDEAATHSFNLLNSLLEWSLSQTNSIRVKTECVELKLIVENAIANMEVQAKSKKISIKNLIETDIKIKADIIMASSVLRNIISNAVKFTNIGGSIEVSCFNATKAGYTSIEIKDNGIGISQDVIGNLFNLKTHITTYGTGNEKGTGLGLLICKDFVELNGGWIDVESQVGNGTKFIVNLPSC